MSKQWEAHLRIKKSQTVIKQKLDPFMNSDIQSTLSPKLKITLANLIPKRPYVSN